MKREERNTLTALRRGINNGTINVEVPTSYTKEGRQEIHHMLTLEKGFVAVRIYWNDIKGCTAVHYIPAGEVYAQTRREQETADIDTLTASLPDCSAWTWNGYRRPGTEDEPATEETTDTENTTDTAENEKGDAPMNNTITASTIIDMVDHLVSIRKNATRSAWNRGLTAYAAELTEGLREAVEGGYFDPDDLSAPRLVERELLNGASDWSQYSWGGCSLIFDRQIAERLCTKSELRQTRNGERKPNRREEWLDVQTRALYQASALVVDALREVLRMTAPATVE